MAVFSKFFVETLGLRITPASCYELCHTWNPDCYRAINDALPGAILFCFKTYGSLYLVWLLYFLFQKIFLLVFRSIRLCKAVEI